MIPRYPSTKRCLLLAIVLMLCSSAFCLPAAASDKADDHLKRGDKLRQKGDLTRAIVEYQEALGLKPDFTEARTGLAIVHFLLSEGLTTKKDLDGAAHELQEALRLMPEEAYWHFALGELYEKKGDHQGALNEYLRASQLVPDDPGLRSTYEELENKPANAADEHSHSPKGQESGGPYAVGKAVSPPGILNQHEPPYSEEAREARYQGTLVMSVIIDAEGKVSDVRVVKPLGMGLDQQAVRTVRTWKFKPATRNGVAVPVRVLVQVTFRLF